MTATVTTKQIKDGAGTIFLQRVLDASGTGAGPFLPLAALTDPDGTAPIDVAALTGEIVAALTAGLVLGAGSAVIGKVGTQVGGADISSTNPLPVGGAQLATATATIASGASLSNAVDLGTGRLVGLIMPAAWTTASISFQGSADGSSYFDLYDDATERAIASSSLAPSRFIALPIADWLMLRALKIRSGSAATPVSQSADRAITLVTAR